MNSKSRGCIQGIGATSGRGTAKHKHLVKLRQTLTTRFNDSELRTLAFDLGVDYESLPGTGKADKARELLAYVQRRDRISELVEAGRQLRPDISWVDVCRTTIEAASTVQSSLQEPLPQLRKRVLVVEDELAWQKLIDELLREIGQELGCTIETVIATRFEEALDLITTTPYDCVTIDNQLQDSRMAKTLLDRTEQLDQRVQVVIVSGAVDPTDVRDFFKKYDIYEFFWKGDFEPGRFRQVLRGLLAPQGKARDEKT